jgi:hypothetical protein
VFPCVISVEQEHEQSEAHWKAYNDAKQEARVELWLHRVRALVWGGLTGAGVLGQRRRRVCVWGGRGVGLPCDGWLCLRYDVPCANTSVWPRDGVLAAARSQHQGCH